MAKQELLMIKQERLAGTVKDAAALPSVKNKLGTEGAYMSHEKILKVWITLEKIGDNVWEHNFRTGKTYFSQKEFDLLGYPSEMLIDNAALWWSLIHKDDIWILQENDKAYKEGRLDHHSAEYRMHHHNGSIRWVLDRGVVVAGNTSRAGGEDVGYSEAALENAGQRFARPRQG